MGKLGEMVVELGVHEHTYAFCGHIAEESLYLRQIGLLAPASEYRYRAHISRYLKSSSIRRRRVESSPPSLAVAARTVYP